MEQQKKYKVLAFNKLSGKMEVLSGWMSLKKAAEVAVSIDPNVYLYSAIATYDNQTEINF